MTGAERGTTSVSANYQKLRSLLQELFQLDQADLDFGIYRIMNQKREEVVRFLDKDLLPQVKKAFEAYRPADKAILQEQLDQAIQQANSLGVDPEQTNKVKELRQKIAESAVDVTALENEVFSHLTNFFRRYYSDGDLVSLRRFRKEGNEAFAIPYDGEEVKLHWANTDQYYVKSSENFRDYTFMIAGGKRVRVHLVAATTEQDNNKEAQGKERRFVLCADEPLREENGELYISFEYRPTDGEKQEELNQQAIQRILQAKGFDPWAQELSRLAPTDKNKDRTLIEKHLKKYTDLNKFDYFIHKDLGAFLRRELDFFIKNEVMHLDDIEHELAPRVEQYLSQIRVIRFIAHKIIAFLEQLENFQKKLWLKKKFVAQTNYCITLDRVPEELYTEIAKNDAQREEWVRLFSIDEIKKDLHSPGYSKPLKVAFLKAQPHLPISTRHFDRAFVSRLLQSLDDLSCLDGVLLHSENLHALRLMKPLVRGSIRFIYIDPPFNTGDDGFLYKDNYQHSSWASLLYDRLAVAHSLLTPDGTIAVSIDQEEIALLRLLMDSLFGHDNLISLITVKRGSVTGHKAINPGVVNISEYVLVYAKNRKAWSGNAVYSQRDRDTRYSTFVTNPTKPESKWEFIPLLDAVATHHHLSRDKLKDTFGDGLEEVVVRFVAEHGDSVIRLADVNVGGVGEDFRAAVAESRKSVDKVILHKREGYPDVSVEWSAHTVL
jgi:adenine-specific DNA-methyltransferase